MSQPTSQSVSLGLVKAIHVDVTPPENIYMIWVDISVRPFVHKYFNTQVEQWVASTGNGNTQNNLIVSDRVIFVSIYGDDSTGEIGNLSKTFKTLTGAIAKAKTGHPSGIKRFTIVVYPGVYQEVALLDADFIDVICATEQAEFYSSDLATNTVNNGNLIYAPGDRAVQFNKLTVKASNNLVKGLYCATLEIATLGTTNNVYQSLVCAEIVHNDYGLTGGFVHGKFYDVHAPSFLPGSDDFGIQGSFTKCGTVNGFLVNVGHNSYVQGIFEQCYFYQNCFGDVLAQTRNSRFVNCDFFDDNLTNVQNTEFVNCRLRHNNLHSVTGCKFNSVFGGDDCVGDFTDTQFKDCLFGGNFAAGGVLPLVTGDFTNTTADVNFANGFVQGRPWRGKMRAMEIICSNAARPALNIASDPADIAIVEYSRIKNCTSGALIAGNYAEISFCKLNKGYSITNTLGTDAEALNVVTDNLCTWDSDSVVAVCPFVTGLTAVNNSGSLVVTFVAPTASGSNPLVKYIIHYYDPTTPNAPHQQQQTTTSSTTIPVTPGIAYKVSVVTICTYSQSNGATGVVDATVTSSQQTAWRARQSSAYCQTGGAVYGVGAFISNSGFKATRSFDDSNGSTTQWNFSLTDSDSVTHNITAQFPVGVLTVFVASAHPWGTPTPTGQTWTNRQTSANSGYLAYATLEEYYVGGLNNGQLTGQTKNNVDTDPDYVAPVYDTATCTLPVVIVGGATVYMRLAVTELDFEFENAQCSIGGPQEKIGTFKKAELVVDFFRDADTVIPFDITGRGITEVLVNRKEVGTSIPPTPLTIPITGTGFSQSLGSNWQIYESIWGCGNRPIDAVEKNYLYTLVSVSGKYTAVQ